MMRVGFAFLLAVLATLPAAGTVRLRLTENGLRSAPRDWATSTVTVNGVDYTPEQGKDGWYVEVREHGSGLYMAALVTGAPTIYCPESVMRPFLPLSQSVLDDFSAFPMFAQSQGKKGLVFRDCVAMLDISLTGSGEIVSLKVEDPDGSPLAGSAYYRTSQKELALEEGVPFVVLNCSAAPVTLSGEPARLRLMLAPGNYESGLVVRLTDSDHCSAEYRTEPLSLKANEVTSIAFDYAPDDDLLLWECFDSFVWGADALGNKPGYAPARVVSPSVAPGWDGMACAFEKVTSPIAGSSYIQSDKWSDVYKYSVGTSLNSLMSTDYIVSRSATDYGSLFRCQEYPGYLAVGTASSARGIFQTPVIRRMVGVGSVELSMDISLQEGFNDDLQFSILGAGELRSITWDGRELPMDRGAYSLLYQGYANYAIPNPSLGSGRGWHRLVAVVDKATSGSYFQVSSNTAKTSVNGFYLDNIKVTRLSAEEWPRGDLRVLYWNIQNGMWADQQNGYDNFVEWVRGYDPDVCVWCEASSIYEDNTDKSTQERYLPDGWSELAARYGHQYVSIGGFRDNYPQVVTSKYPITTLLKICDSGEEGKPISHGAGVHRINVDGQDIDIVSLHLWPQAYSYGAKDKDASKANAGGDLYRAFEMERIVEMTVNNPDFAGCDKWLVMGDFNSRSRVDNGFYKLPEDSSQLLAQDVILNNTDLVDLIHAYNPDLMVPSTYGASRVDYMYASPAMYNLLSTVHCVVDAWTVSYKSSYISTFYNPSDHRPILADFDL